MEHNSLYIPRPQDRRRAHGRQTQLQPSTSTSATGDAPSPSRCSDRSVVSFRRVLRSPGHRPSQVRDAAPCRDGQSARGPCCLGIRFFPAIVLSGASRVLEVRNGWPDPPEEGTAPRPQVLTGNSGVRRLLTSRTTRSSPRGPGAANPKKIRCWRASAQCRACPGTQQKKTALNRPGPGAPREIDPLVTRYEELRSQVLNGVAAGHGHALLLRQGLRAWVEAWSCCALGDAPREHPAPGPTALLPPTAQAETVALLATLVLSARRHASV